MSGGHAGGGLRLKPVPRPPDDLDGLRAAHRAVPLVPGSEDDCCARLQQRLDLPSREEARTWLTFLRALGLAEETRSGYARTRIDLVQEGVVVQEGVEREEVAASFREGVFAAREVLAALDSASEPLDADAVFEGIEDVVPQWERHRDPTWRDTWRERVARLLEWAVLFGLAERDDGGYRAAGDADL